MEAKRLPAGKTTWGNPICEKNSLNPRFLSLLALVFLSKEVSTNNTLMLTIIGGNKLCLSHQLITLIAKKPTRKIKTKLRLQMYF
jgi:hypothetical protein